MERMDRIDDDAAAARSGRAFASHHRHRVLGQAEERASALPSLSVEERVEQNDPTLAVLRIGAGDGCGVDLDQKQAATASSAAASSQQHGEDLKRLVASYVSGKLSGAESRRAFEEIRRGFRDGRVSKLDCARALNGVEDIDDLPPNLECPAFSITAASAAELCLARAQVEAALLDPRVPKNGCSMTLDSDVDWTEFGTSVANNNHLKELKFLDLDMSSDDREDRMGEETSAVDRFFGGLFGGNTYARDRGEELTRTGSIQTLVLKDCPSVGEMVFQHALPMLAHNKCMRCLVMDDVGDFAPAGEKLHRFMSDFRSWLASDLKFVKAIRVLPPNGPQVDILGSIRALALRNGGLKKVVIWRGGFNRNGQTARSTLALLLSESNNLIVLDLYSDHRCVDEDVVALLLGGKEGVKIIQEDLQWRVVLRRYYEPEDGKTFHFCRNPGVGAEAFYDLLRSPGCMLKELSFGGHSFTDVTVAPLLEALGHNSSLRSLDLSGSLRQATRMTWRGIAALLHNPKSGLEKLDLCYSPINNDALLAFASALSDNKRMAELLLYNSSDWNTRWESFSRLLCNKSSVTDTFNSNHTLRRLTKGAKQPGPLRALLEMNKSEDKPDVARRKIISQHFTGDMDTDMQHFIDMDFAVLPHAISWMAGGDLLLFFDFVRKMPLYYESGGRNGSEGSSRNVKRQKKEEMAAA